MEEKNTPQERNMDRRLLERNLRKGIITQADINTFEQGLKDASNNMEVFSIDSEEEEEAEPAKANASRLETPAQPASVISFSDTQGGA